MPKQINNLKHLKVYRKELRNNPTKSESMLWKAIQRKQLNGRKFRRQHSLGNFIVDFYCPQERLIVELDGEVHNNFVNESYDDKRTEGLKALGMKVIRFENKLVFGQIDMVLDAIRQEFKE